MKLSMEYSTRKISKTLLSEIKKALKSVKYYGSVEIYIQEGSVTQISVRNIKKTNHDAGDNGPVSKYSKSL
ncbi:DUF2292 domain-containing protein [Candidatus Woesebacteria bacterium]|nr:DUF2292 domain-containing protein [Candidatus Woesebacteria bacterium]